MLNRQKSLISLLHYAGGVASHLQLVKWSFLITQETDTSGGAAYYEFLPYRFGPYSFTLRYEIDNLVRDGFVKEVEEKHWAITDNAKNIVGSAHLQIKQEAKSIVWKYGKLTEQELLDSVYDHYPWFTVNSQISGGRREKRPIAKLGVYTVGYEGRTVDGLLNQLLKGGISGLVDVRHNPVARRFGFHKSRLSSLCGHLGIKYLHYPKLGIPSSFRCELKNKADYIKLLTRYDKEILPDNWETLASVAEIIQSEPTVLMCTEADPKICHRSRIAKAASALTGLPVVHLVKEEDD